MVDATSAPAAAGTGAGHAESLCMRPTSLPEVKLLTPRMFSDGRGWFRETWNRRCFAAAGIDPDFVQDNAAFSAEAGTIRGLHFQLPPAAQGKLVRVVRGCILDAVVDIRRGSPRFGCHATALLTAEGGEQLWVPPGFAHGYCTLQPDCEVFYKVTAHHAPAQERGIRFDDPAIGIAWPMSPDRALLNDRDRAWPSLAELVESFEFGVGA